MIVLVPIINLAICLAAIYVFCLAVCLARDKADRNAVIGAILGIAIILAAMVVPITQIYFWFKYFR